MRKIILSAALFMAVSTTSYAQQNTNPFEGAYAGAMIGYSSFSFDDLNENIDGLTYGGLAGYRVEMSDGFLVGLEGYVNGNEADKDFIILGNTVNFSADVSYGFNGTLGFGQDRTYIFVMAGYGWTDFSASAQSLTVGESGDGIRAGIGFEYKLTDQVNLRVQGDWQDFDSAYSLGASAGFVLSF